METAVTSSVFSVPLRQLWSTSFTGDQVISDGTVKGLARFVGDSSNELLRYFSLETAPSSTDWPLVLYGRPGTGKTSLAMAILASVLARYESDRFEKGNEAAEPPITKTTESNQPVFVTAADYVRRLKSAIDTDSVVDFRRRYSHGLMIDNLHHLAKHPAAQQEVCYLLNRLTQNGRPFIATCEKIPSAYDSFLPQLISRLEGGLCLPTNAPGVGARKEIIRDLCEIYGLNISRDGVDAIAQRLKVTVPKLNHFLAHLKTHAEIETVEADFIQKLFDQLIETNSHQKIKTITHRVATTFGLKVTDLKSNSRKQTIVLARGVCIYLCRELLNQSFQKIGSCFGNRDHSTIMHAYRKIEKLIESSEHEATRKTILDLKQGLLDTFSEFSFEDLENLSKTS